ncbi:MAG: YidC/Oxa1 family insertase periplasmic-domain containing protein [Pirellulaceae bacterium]
MEKRFVLFLVLAMAIIFGHLALRQMFAPPQPVVPVVPDHKVADPDEDQAAPPNEPHEAAPNEDALKKTDLPGESEAAEKVVPKEKPPERPAVPQQWSTIGSFAPNAPGAMLVIFNNRGAGIERIELTERTRSGRMRYRNLANRSGYLGHLALKSEPQGGCRVNVVGHGTPAATALPVDTDWGPGLQVGDLLKTANGEPVQVRRDLEAILEKAAAGDQIPLSVERDFDGQARTTDFTAVLAERPLELIRPEPLMEGELSPHPLSLLVSLERIGEKEVIQGFGELAGMPSLRNSTWSVATSEDPHPTVEFRFVLDESQLAEAGVSGSLEIVKRFRLREDPNVAATEPGTPLHHLEFEIELINRGENELKVAYRLDGPNGLPLEGWWYSNKIHPRMFKGAGARDVLYRTDTEPHRLISCPDIYKYAQENPRTPDKVFFDSEKEPPSVEYAAVDTQFFLAALKTRTEGPHASDKFRRGAAVALGGLGVRKGKLIRKTNVSFHLTSTTLTIPPGESVQRDFVLFAGPKDTKLLAAYDLGGAVYYGWFSKVARPLSALLHFFYSIVGNYGLAIIMLTVLVRGCMFPLGRKAAKNAAMMQELAPEMRAIAEKYKNEMDKRAKAQQDLFRKHNYNPLGGCWLMFFQLPIFIGLYRSLAVDIELRDAALVPGIEWCSNLAGPDKLLYWGEWMPSFLASETGMLGPYLNVLPLVTIALFLVQQKLFTPPPTDDQSRMQMKMMKFMMLFMGLLFFKVASGLCLYFIASALWSVAERKLVPKPKPNAPGGAAAPAKAKSKSTFKPDASRPQRRPNMRKRPKKR